MATFKVICKAEKSGWQKYPIPQKTIVTTNFFGFNKRYKIVSDPQPMYGPAKEEICIVTSDYIFDKELYYKLEGYPHGGYNSKYFIRLDELMETQKEIAEKSQPVLN